MRLKLISVTAAVLGLLLIPATAFAYAPTGDDFITCVAGGDNTVECAAGVFDPNSEVDVLVEINPVLLDTTVTADDNGEIEFSFDVPEGQEGGEVTVTLEGTLDGEAKVLASAVASVEEDGEVIANAGSDAAVLAGAAVGAIALGGAALFASRRKRTTTAA